MLKHLHPASVHFPIGLLFAAWLVILGGFFYPEQVSSFVVTAVLVTGLLASIPAVATGLWELVKLGDSASPEAEKTLWWHLGLVGASVTLFLASLLTYVESLSLWTLGLSSLGLVILGVGGHFGGQLVYKHRIGLDAESPSASRGEDVNATGGS